MRRNTFDGTSSGSGSGGAAIDVPIAQGCRVEVLPGRQFPSFAAGDVGTVKRVDEEARTCDVLFDTRAVMGPVPVALRHLFVIEAPSSPYSPRGYGEGADGLAQLAEGLLSSSHGAHRASVNEGSVLRKMQSHDAYAVAISATLGSAGSAVGGGSASAELVMRLSRLEARVASVEAAAAECEPGAIGSGRPAGRLVAARVAVLEGAHQAEIAQLRRSLDEAVSLGREQDQIHRKHRSSTRELDGHFEEVDRRCANLREFTRGLQEELGRLSTAMSSQEQRAANLEEVVHSAGDGLATLGSLLEGQERRTSELGQALSTASADLAQLSKRLEDSRQRDLGRGELSGAAERGERDFDRRTSQREERQREDIDSVWKALRELQELVVHESEHRAAGLREVLGVL
ncbi:unnamed protein product, partial [Polarella glacialis]